MLKAGAVCAVFFSFPLFGAEASKKPFDLPSDAAERTLKSFAAQSGLEVLFVTDVTENIQTNAVKGEFTPRVAIDRMLAGTALIATENKQTGAFKIQRDHDPSGPSAAQKTGDSPKSKKKTDNELNGPTKTMSPKTRHTLLGALFAVFTASDSLQAQALAPAADTPSSRPKEGLVELSPFVVSSEKDTGYQATSTLAGTRLSTPIKDLAASISIYTKDFLEDIGATSSNELLIYATGMEASGPGGTISASTNLLDFERPYGEAARTDPQGVGSRSRGLAAPTFTRGYFATSIAFDSYNTAAVTVNRGPNAALFGIGSAAGVVDTTLLAADLNRNTNKVVFRYGNNNAMRESVDFNRVLIPKVLAARVALLRDNQKYNQRPAFEDKKRIYGTLTFQPFKTTSFRGNFESGSTYANRPITLMVNNDVSSVWLAAGRPGYDWTLYDDPAKNPAAATQAAGAATEGNLIGTNNIGGPVFIYSNPTDQTPSYTFTAANRTTTTYAADAIASQIFNPLVNRDQATDSARFLHTFNLWDLPAAYWTTATLAAAGARGQQPGYVPVGMKLQSFSDYAAFDWRNRLIDESGRQSDSFHAFNLALSQTAWGDRIGLEIAYDRQRVDRRGRDAFFGGSNLNRIMIDVNATLPTGQPNPNYGRPFVTGSNLQWRDIFQDNDAQRATAYIKYDFKELSQTWGKWLGRHTLTGLYENRGSTTANYVHQLAARSALLDKLPGNIFQNSRRPTFITYVGPSLIGNNNPLRLEPVQIPAFTAGPAAAVSDFVRAANQTDPGHFETSPASFVDINGGGSAQREVIKSQTVVLQSYWWKDHLITMLNWRRDEDYFVQRAISYVENPNDRLDPGQTFYGLDDFRFPHTPPLNMTQETTAYGVVLAWPKELVKLPKGTDLSGFFNQSSNFTPVAGRVDYLARPWSPPKGTTKEYGLNFSAFDGKLNVRLNRFDTAIQGTSSSPTFISNYRSALLTVPATWATEGNLNPQLAAQRNADIELLFSVLPANFRQLYLYSVSGTSPNIVSSVNTGAVPNTTDISDFRARGLEMDVTYNVTKNWRVLLNVAKEETVRTNQYPFSRYLAALMKPVWDKLSNRPVGHYPTGFQPGDTLPANVQTYGQYLDQNIYVPLASAIASEGSVSAEQRKWRANFVTNYTFDHDSLFGAKLKGWGIGGAVRWQDKLAIGYPGSRDPDGTVHFDIQNPFYVPPLTNVDGWVSYARRVWDNKLHWKLQLNVSNIVNNGDLVGVTAQSWNGTVGQYRLPPERRWYLTSTFSF